MRLVKEGGVDVVKMEGGAPSRVSAARAIVDAGIAVIGHVGLTPQAISALGGFRAQGKTVDGALKVVEAALALQDAGCFAVVLECVPSPVAAAATTALQIPTIGIGAGPLCSGQVYSISTSIFTVLIAVQVDHEELTHACMHDRHWVLFYVVANMIPSCAPI